MMPLRAGQRLGWRIVGFHLGFRHDPHPPGPMRAVHNVAVLADEQGALAADSSIVFHIIGSWRTEPAVRPVQLDRRHVTPGREFKANDGGDGVCFIHNVLVEMRRGGLDLDGIHLAQLQRPEDRI